MCSGDGHRGATASGNVISQVDFAQRASGQNDGVKRAWVEFSWSLQPGYVGSHRWWSGEVGAGGGQALDEPKTWEPPVEPVPGKGYARIFVEVDGFVFQFISTLEMAEAASVLERNLVDRETSQRRWYRKLPAKVKAKHTRARAANAIREAAAAYESQLPELAKLPSPVPQASGYAPAFRADLRL